MENDVLDEEGLSAWTKKKLVAWLVDHKKKKSGNKKVLVDRILRSVRFDDSDSDWGSDTDEEYTVPSISSLDNNWEPLLTNLCPPLRSEDVDNYFLFNKNPVTGKTQGCHRQLKKAKKFCKEKYIYDLEHNEIGDSPYCYIRGKCKPSMKEVVNVGVHGQQTQNYTLHVVLIKSTGKIESGHCNCKPGLSGLCSHIGGLLLTLVEIKEACTSKGCAWLKPQTDLQMKPKRLEDIRFTTNGEATTKPYPDTYQAGLCKDPDTFLCDIMAGLKVANPNSVLYRTMDPDITDLSDITSKYQPPFMFTDSVDLNSMVCQSEFRTFAAGIHLQNTDIQKVTDSTRGQSANPLWKEVRTNIITASNFGAVCKKRVQTEPDNLIARLRGYSGDFDSKPMKYGRKKESQARRDYAKGHLKRCGKVNVETTGLMISKSFPFLGASVDAMVNCEKCSKGVLEIKCPYVGRNVTPQEWSAMKSACVTKTESGELQLNAQHNYMFQIMGQMKVLDLDWCDFVVWTKKGISVERIRFNPDFWMYNMLSQLTLFYNSWFLAERFSDRVKRGKKLFG